MTVQPMTDDDRRQITVQYFKRLDTGQDFYDLFADDAYVYFPKHEPARGMEEVRQLFTDIIALFRSIVHEVPYFNYIIQGEQVVVEGTTNGMLADGTEGHAGRGTLGCPCADIFEIRDSKIQRLFIYLDPDYADADTARYASLTSAQ